MGRPCSTRMTVQGETGSGPGGCSIAPRQPRRRFQESPRPTSSWTLRHAFELSALVHARAPAIRKDLLPPAWYASSQAAGRIAHDGTPGPGRFNPQGVFQSTSTFRVYGRAGRYPPLCPAGLLLKVDRSGGERGRRGAAESIATVQFPARSFTRKPHRGRQTKECRRRQALSLIHHVIKKNYWGRWREIFLRSYFGQATPFTLRCIPYQSNSLIIDCVY